MKKILYILTLSVKLTLFTSAQTTFMQSITNPTLIVDVIGGAENGGVHCFGGRHGDIVNNWSGKIYACDNTGSTVFQRLHRLAGRDIFYTDVARGQSGSFHVCGYSIPFVGGTPEAIVTSIDAAGNVLYATSFSNGYDIYSTIRMLEGRDSGCYVGWSNIQTGSYADVFLIHHRNGVILDQLELRTDTNLATEESLIAMNRGADGGFYLLGQNTDASYVLRYTWLTKLDSLLNHRWTVQFPDTAFHFADFDISTEGSLLLYGRKQNTVGENEPFLSRIDSTGSVSWTKTYSSSMINYIPLQIAATIDGGATLIGGEFYSIQNYTTTSRIRVDEQGDVAFSAKLYGAMLDFEPFYASTSSDGSLWISGRNLLGIYGLIMKLDPDAMSACYDSVVAVTVNTETLSGAFITPMITSGNMVAISENLIVDSSLHKSNLCFSTGIEEEPKVRNVSVNNPVGSTLVLNQVSDYRQLTVYDLSGRKLITREKNTEDEWRVDVQCLPAGCYIVHLQGPRGNEVAKVSKQ